MANTIKNQGLISVLLTLCLLFASTVSQASVHLHTDSSAHSSHSSDCCGDTLKDIQFNCSSMSHNCAGAVCGSVLSLPTSLFSFTPDMVKPKLIIEASSELLPEFQQPPLRPPIA